MSPTLSWPGATAGSRSKSLRAPWRPPGRPRPPPQGVGSRGDPACPCASIGPLPSTPTVLPAGRYGLLRASFPGGSQSSKARSRSAAGSSGSTSSSTRAVCPVSGSQRVSTRLVVGSNPARGSRITRVTSSVRSSIGPPLGAAASRGRRRRTSGRFRSRLRGRVLGGCRNDGSGCQLAVAVRRAEVGAEELLGNQRRDERAQDHHGDELAVLGLGDEVVGQAVEGGDRAEGQSGGHQQGGVGAVAPGEMKGRGRAYTTLLMATGLTFGSISALYGLTNHLITQAQYSQLVTVVILSAFVPT